MTEAVVFDLDGTLIHLPINSEKLSQEFSKIMKTKNVRPLTKTISKLDENTKKEVFDAWDKAELAALPEMTTNKEGVALYSEFSEKPRALVTMQGTAVVHNVLKSLDLSFDAVVTREDSLERVEQLKIAAKKLKSAHANVLFIGNTDDDFLAARKFQCRFMRVAEEK